MLFLAATYAAVLNGFAGALDCSVASASFAAVSKKNCEPMDPQWAGEGIANKSIIESAKNFVAQFKTHHCPYPPWNGYEPRMPPFKSGTPLPSSWVKQTKPSNCRPASRYSGFRVFRYIRRKTPAICADPVKQAQSTAGVQSWHHRPARNPPSRIRGTILSSVRLTAR